MKCMINQDGSRSLIPSEPLSPQEGYCVFRVKACGICGSDIPRVFHGTSYYYPIVLGHEFAGIVTDSKQAELIGKRACVFPILPCQTCEFCQKQQWANCQNYRYYGSRCDGGMQSELLIKETNLVFLPDNVSYEAGSLTEPTAVCLHAVKKADISPQSTVLIYGAGTIGLLCGMWANVFGAEHVYISDPDEARLSMAKKLGFSPYCGETVNTVIEASGAVSALNHAISVCQAFGKIVLVGHGTQDVTISHSNFVQILRKQLTVCGSWNSDFTDTVNDWKESVQAISENRISPSQLITHKIPLAQADKAFRIIHDQTEFYNKITVVM